jgi:Fe2+ or Zn2+ uptake regulation protein
MDATGIRELFTRHDLRWTKQREEVYAALAASESHPTAEELFNLVGPREASAGDDGGTSLATVYNTLEALVRCGLARRFSAAGEGCGIAHRYDADMSNHAHLVGVDGGVRDLPDDLSQRVIDAIPRDIIEQIEHRLGVSIGRTSIEFVQGRAAPPGAEG